LCKHASSKDIKRRISPIPNKKETMDPQKCISIEKRKRRRRRRKED
jgi:hypothetical protein